MSTTTDPACAAGRSLRHPDPATGFDEPCRRHASMTAIIVNEDINEFVGLCAEHYRALARVLDHRRFPRGRPQQLCPATASTR